MRSLLFWIALLSCFGYNLSSLRDKITRHLSARNGNYNIKEKIISDLIADIINKINTADIVIVTSTNFAYKITLRHVTVVSFNTVTEEDIDKLKIARLKNNIRPLYFVITEDPWSLYELLTLIRSGDYSNAIIAFTREFDPLPNNITKDFYNTYTITKLASSEFAFNEVCMFCNGGADIVKSVNKWSPHKSFSKDFKSPVSFKKSFHGKKLRYGCRNQEYFLRMIQKFIAPMEHSINFSVSIISRTGNNISLFLTEGVTDFDGCGTAMTWERYQYADFSLVYSITDVKMYSMKPKRGLHWYSFMKPFQPVTWACIALIIPTCGGTLYILCRLDVNAKKIPVKDCLWDATKILFWDTIQASRTTTPIYLLLGLYLMASHIIVLCYSGVVTSFFTIKPYLWDPFDEMMQFKKSSVRYLVKKGHFQETFFMDDPLVRSRMKYVSNSKSALQVIQKSPMEYVYFGAGTERTIQNNFMDTNGNHPFHISRDTLTISLAGFFFKKTSLFQEIFNIEIAKLWETGIILHGLNMYNFEQKLINFRKAKEKKRYGPSPASDSIKLVHMSGGFIILVLGVTLAFISHVFNATKKMYCNSDCLKNRNFSLK